MIDVSAEVQSWKTNKYGWAISPDVEWCPKGNHVRIGKGVKIGDDVTIRSYATIGNDVTIGNHAAIGNSVKLGKEVVLGSDTHLASDTRLGDGLILPEKTTFACDLGIQSRYRHALIVQKGVVKFVGGCHVFTFAAAREYWAGKPDHVETLAAVDFAEVLAGLIPEIKDLPKE